MKIFTKIAAGLLSIIALLHAIRLVYGWEVIFAGFVIPIWASGFGVAIASIVAWGLWKESK